LGKGDNLSIKMPSGVNYFYLKAESGLLLAAELYLLQVHP